MAYVSKINGYDIKDKELREQVGTLGLLNTTNKETIVESINSLYNKEVEDVRTLTQGVEDTNNTIGSLDNLDFAEIGGDTANVVAAINAVHRRMSNELEPINDSLDTIGNNLTNLSDNVYVKDNYAILEGEVTLDANSGDNLAQGDLMGCNEATRTITGLSYPTGFTMDNCICIALLVSNYNKDRWSNFAQDSVSVSARNLTGAIPRDVVLKSDGIDLHISNFVTQTISVKYKLVLLKYKD